MSTESIVLEHLSAIRATLDEHSEMLREIERRLGGVEHQNASVSDRIDRLDERMQGIERSLDII